MRIPAHGLDIPRLGVDTRHPASFCIDRPRGSGDYLYLRFDTETTIKDRHGTAVHPAGVHILYAPGFHQWYRCDGNAMLAHWLHFSAPKAPAAIAALAIPVNTCFRATDAAAIPVLLSTIAHERLRADDLTSESIALAFNQLLIAISRESRAAASATAPGPRHDQRQHLRSLFTDLCLDIQRRPEKTWDLPTMAREVGLSRSRFCAVFSELFGIAPGEWLAKQRMDRAAYLLTTGMPAIEVAAATGFASPSHFAKMFRKHHGCAPSAYARLHHG